MAAPVRAGGTVFESGPRKAVLVELFTSEGCSSCPPAEAWVSKMVESPDLWHKFVPAAFHVDYWNAFGWKDPLSSADFTARQRKYVAGWKSDSTYTPMVVADGEEKRQWYFGLDASPREDAGVLRARHAAPGQWEVEYLPHNGAYLDRVTVHAAFLGMGIDVPVERGENQGKVLRHDFAVLAFSEKEMAYEAGVLKAPVRFESVGAVEAPHHAIAVWVTRKGSDEPLQALGGMLD